MSKTELRIGEAAALVDVTTRTLRYYQELGLLSPAGCSPGGARRYSEEDVARLMRIRELQEIASFDLEEIKSILDCEDRLSRLRLEFKNGDIPSERREQIVLEAIEINERMRDHVQAKLKRGNALLADLEKKRAKYKRFLASVRAAGRA